MAVSLYPASAHAYESAAKAYEKKGDVKNAKLFQHKAGKLGAMLNSFAQQPLSAFPVCTGTLRLSDRESRPAWILAPSSFTFYNSN
jgi:hypothetical protein